MHDVAERMRDARSRDSSVPCPGCGPAGASFPDAVVIQHVPPTTWDELVAARESLTRTLVGAVREHACATCILIKCWEDIEPDFNPQMTVRGCSDRRKGTQKHAKITKAQ